MAGPAAALLMVEVTVMAEVEMSNTAVNMVASLYRGNRPALEQTLESIKRAVTDPGHAKKVDGLRDTYVARSGGLRIIFTMRGNQFVITSIETNA